MIAVYYFSGAGHSRAVADYFAVRLGVGAVRIEDASVEEKYDVAVVVFPVYCQNVPEPVRAFLPLINARFAAVIATFGGISPGNVLCDARDLLRCPLTAAACVPTGHSLLSEGYGFDKEPLEAVIKKVADPSPAEIPKMKKSAWADVAPGIRSRIGTKIVKSPSCDGCGRCVDICPAEGDPKRCIRCLRCVTECPNGALTVKNRYALRKYLNRERETDTTVYV